MSKATTKPNRTRRERLEEREAAIVSAAHDAFSELGFDGAKMSEIARRAEVAEGTVYLYFKNKQALLQAVTSAFYEQLTEGAAEGVADTGDTFERLEFLARHHLVNCLDEWPMLELTMRLYRSMAEYKDRGHYKFNKAYVAVFDNVVREGANRGEIRDDIPLWIIRDMFYGSLEYSLRTHLLRNRPAKQIDDIARKIMSMVRRGIASDTDRDQGDASQDLTKITRRLEAIAKRLEKS